MVNLYFNDSNGNDRLITVCDEKLVMQYIHNFINECNRKNAEKGAKTFKSYYTRTWTDPDGKTWYDVGSHTEFFWTKEVEYG